MLEINNKGQKGAVRFCAELHNVEVGSVPPFTHHEAMLFFLDFKDAIHTHVTSLRDAEVLPAHGRSTALLSDLNAYYYVVYTYSDTRVGGTEYVESQLDTLHPSLF